MVNTYEYLLDTYIFIAETKLDDKETLFNHTVYEERMFFDKLKNDQNYRKYFHTQCSDLITNSDYGFHQFNQLFYIICSNMLDTYKGEDLPEELVKTLK